MENIQLVKNLQKDKDKLFKEISKVYSRLSQISTASFIICTVCIRGNRRILFFIKKNRTTLCRLLLVRTRNKCQRQQQEQHQTENISHEKPFVDESKYIVIFHKLLKSFLHFLQFCIKMMLSHHIIFTRRGKVETCLFRKNLCACKYCVKIKSP